MARGGNQPTKGGPVATATQTAMARCLAAQPMIPLSDEAACAEFLMRLDFTPRELAQDMAWAIDEAKELRERFTMPHPPVMVIPKENEEMIRKAEPPRVPEHRETISQPTGPGAFDGDLWYGHPRERTLATHYWDATTREWKLP